MDHPLKIPSHPDGPSQEPAGRKVRYPFRGGSLEAILVVVLYLLGLGGGGSAAEPPPVGPLLQQRTQVLHDALVGSWRTRIGDRSLAIRLDGDGSLHLDDRTGQWSVTPAGQLELHIGGERDQVMIAFTNGQLVLSGGALPQAMTFARDPVLSEFMIGWFGLEASSSVQRGMRLFAILVWIALARLLIIVVRYAANRVIFSRRGPFKLVFPRRPQRASTLLSLVLNTCTYVVYGVGLGFVLNTFDIDYTTYLASLSVIGLAIGFGSQGLVQDMVTGIFIILEGQFHVGDIVEISGQIGRVEEMGLRMTRLRTILGQTITVPNRSIATVARFGDGLRIEVSLLVADESSAEQAGRAAESIGAAISRQFPAAFLRLGPARTTPSGDRWVVALPMLLWPGQQAILDQHFLPRLRSALPPETYGDTATSLAWHFVDHEDAAGPMPSTAS